MQQQPRLTEELRVIYRIPRGIIEDCDNDTILRFLEPVLIESIRQALDEHREGWGGTPS